MFVSVNYIANEWERTEPELSVTAKHRLRGIVSSAPHAKIQARLNGYMSAHPKGPQTLVRRLFAAIQSSAFGQAKPEPKG
jgi:hypothetical protein